MQTVDLTYLYIFPKQVYTHENVHMYKTCKNGATLDMRNHKRFNQKSCKNVDVYSRPITNVK